MLEEKYRACGCKNKRETDNNRIGTVSKSFRKYLSNTLGKH
jgi:hypothetical protein